MLPTRISNPTTDEIYEKAIQLFQASYHDQNNLAIKKNRLVGKEAILLKSAQIKKGNFSNGEIEHYIHLNAKPLL